jgi:hypothetical protein
VQLGLFADDTCIHATDREGIYVFRKLQRGLSDVETWYERWKVKINEYKTQAIYFSHILRPPDPPLTLTVLKIPFISHVNYLGSIFDKKLPIELTEA